MEEHFRINAGIPFLDHVIFSLNQRFSPALRTSLKTAQLLPSKVINSEENFSDLVEQYRDDLPSPTSFAAELTRWKHKWASADATARPKTILSALAVCDEPYFGNIRNLLEIFAVFPVTTAECERTFSCLKRLKTYLRSTIAQERLVGLALMNIHYDICVSPKELTEQYMAQDHRRTISG